MGPSTLYNKRALNCCPTFLKLKFMFHFNNFKVFFLILCASFDSNLIQLFINSNFLLLNKPNLQHYYFSPKILVQKTFLLSPRLSPKSRLPVLSSKKFPGNVLHIWSYWETNKFVICLHQAIRIYNTNSAPIPNQSKQ